MWLKLVGGHAVVFLMGGTDACPLVGGGDSYPFGAAGLCLWMRLEVAVCLGVFRQPVHWGAGL